MEQKQPTSTTAEPAATSVQIETVVADANDANTTERSLTLWQALRLYPKGVMWSFVMSTAVVMEGFDTKLLGTLYAQPTFRKHFGVHAKGDHWEITAAWQAGLSNGSIIGQLAGLLVAGYLCERFGFRRSMLAGLTLITGLIFISFFAKSLVMLLIGQILFGVPLGFFQTVSVIYALEIAPMCLRAYLTNYVNFCWAFGQILCVGVLRALLNRTDQWSYRIPFALQWVWPVVLIPLVYLAPESPWWLVRAGRLDEARASVKRLTSTANANFDVDKNVALMVVTTEHERNMDGRTTYYACFSKGNLKRTLIGIGIYCVQTLSGNPIRGSSTYFLQQAGMSTSMSFTMSIVGYAVAILGGFFSWLLLPLFGRRSIYVNSLVLMFFLMIVIGSLGVPQASHPASSYSWAIGAILIVSSFLYNCSIGPLTNTLCSEIPSALLRSKSIVLARWTYALTNIVVSVLNPYMLNTTAWNWSAKSAFFWAGWCAVAVAFAFFCVPETKHRSTAELDLLFDMKISPRKFHLTTVDPIAAIRTDMETREMRRETTV
ncbi:hypothetical protein PV08_05844 [Exophiala spinifera]|uniref:Major facilitator superfamily (MFS) profile domain-containing protein n=1 Tax=Exophiala spinifera TaxID=91928 RepID=A0A0D2BWW0_9EURO|nr:uncharacterized protein PV08_05844 [Exophiala spinifera]KIW15794.1 hypothetical protein PV08_05844 [Exophiala spinifera]